MQNYLSHFLHWRVIQMKITRYWTINLILVVTLCFPYCTFAFADSFNHCLRPLATRKTLRSELAKAIALLAWSNKVLYNDEAIPRLEAFLEEAVKNNHRKKVNAIGERAAIIKFISQSA